MSSFCPISLAFFQKNYNLGLFGGDSGMNLEQGFDQDQKLENIPITKGAMIFSRCTEIHGFLWKNRLVVGILSVSI
ncbi:hypothetical protein WDU94_005988 [Cyamophila willieti]